MTSFHAAPGLPGTEGTENAFFSPDGEWVGLSSDRKLKKVSIRGGAAIPLCDVSSLRGASWGEDGHIVAALTNVQVSCEFQQLEVRRRR
jgi:hypothetical protein